MSIITGGKTPVPAGIIKQPSVLSQTSEFKPGRGNSELQNHPDLAELIEVKTTQQSYKTKQNTINARLGEDFEGEKPIMNYQQVHGEVEEEEKNPRNKLL